MPPRLRVLAGPSVEEMEPITANDNRAYRIKSPFFDGAIVVHIKGFPDENGRVLDSEYFSRDDRKGVTWSIQVQGMSTFCTGRVLTLCADLAFHSRSLSSVVLCR